MATERLQIVLDAAWKGRGAVNAAERDLKGVEGAATKTGINMAKLAAGVGVATVALGAVAMGAKAAWQVLDDGAALERSADQFDRLTRSIGSTSEVMLGKLREATNGMVSDADLVANAGQIMALGLAKTEDAVVRLTTVSSKLGWDMSQVILTMANDSVMRLDALGLSVERVNAIMRDFMAQGFSKGEAFDLAVIQAGEEKIKLLGDAADTSAGSMAQLETAWKNANDAFKQTFAEDLADQLTKAADGADSLNTSLVILAQEGASTAADVVGSFISVLMDMSAVAAAIQAGDFKAAQFMGDIFSAGGARKATGYIMGNGSRRSSSGGIIDVPTRRTDTSPRPTRDLDENTDAINRNRAAGHLADQQRQEGAKYMQELADRGLEVTNATDAGTRSMGSYAAAIDEAAIAMQQLAAESGSYFDQARKMKEWNPAEFFYEQAIAAGASAAQLAQVLSATGLESPERIAEILQQAQQMEAIRNLAAGVATGGDVNMLWAGAQASADPNVAANMIAAPQNYNTAVNTNIVINGPVGSEQILELIDQYFRTQVAAQPTG